MTTSHVAKLNMEIKNIFSKIVVQKGELLFQTIYDKRGKYLKKIWQQILFISILSKPQIFQHL